MSIAGLDRYEELYADYVPLNLGRAVDAIKPFVSLKRLDGTIHFTKAGQNLSVKNRILLVFLVRKLPLKHGQLDRKFTGGEVMYHALPNVTRRHLESSLQQLRDKGLITGTPKDYHIPFEIAPKVVKIFEQLRNQHKKDSGSTHHQFN